LEFFYLLLLLSCLLTRASFLHLTGRPEHSTTVILVILLEVKRLALLLVLLLSLENLFKPINLIVE
jgi:hypothetical protein